MEVCNRCNNFQRFRINYVRLYITWLVWHSGNKGKWFSFIKEANSKLPTLPNLEELTLGLSVFPLYSLDSRGLILQLLLSNSLPSLMKFKSSINLKLFQSLLVLTRLFFFSSFMYLLSQKYLKKFLQKVARSKLSRMAII